MINPATLQKSHTELLKIASDKVFGFWVYLMSDCILFATLFVTYVVLQTNYAHGPTGHDIFKLPSVLTETLFLLTSTFTCGLAMLARNHNKKYYILIGLGLTFILGALFIGFEAHEFLDLINKGNGPNRSAFLSGYFTLVGTHGAHVTVGLIWLCIVMFQVYYYGLNLVTHTRLLLFSLFWHFLDIIWICIFTIVYLMGYLL